MVSWCCVELRMILEMRGQDEGFIILVVEFVEEGFFYFFFDFGWDYSIFVVSYCSLFDLVNGGINWYLVVLQVEKQIFVSLMEEIRRLKVRL